MKNRGFTLIELLGVIIILATISLVAFPAILNFMSGSNDKIDKAKEKIIISAAKDYVTDHPNDNNTTIRTEILKSNGYITNKSIVEDKELDNSCVTISNNNYTFNSNCND